MGTLCPLVSLYVGPGDCGKKPNPEPRGGSTMKKVLVIIGAIFGVLFLLGIIGAIFAPDTPEPTTSAAAPVAPAPTTQVIKPTSTPLTPETIFGAGTYQVGIDIAPGIYAGKVGVEIFDSCYWARLSGASGDFSELIGNDNAQGQFYVEIKVTDKYFKVDCDIISLEDWQPPNAPLTDIEPGTYLIGRDIAPGTYRGEAGPNILESCYWARLSGVSGDSEHLIANDNAYGQYFVTVQQSDFALTTGCSLSLTE